MSFIRADRPIGFQLRKSQREASEEVREASSQLLLSCNSLDDRIAMLEAQMENDSEEDEEEYESSEESSVLEDEVEEEGNKCKAGENRVMVIRKKKEDKSAKKGADKMADSDEVKSSLKRMKKSISDNVVAEVDIYGGLVKLSSRLEGTFLTSSLYPNSDC